MKKDTVTRIVERIIFDLDDRRGLKREWQACDEEIQAEIIETWEGICRLEIGETSSLAADVAAMLSAIRYAIVVHHAATGHLEQACAALPPEVIAGKTLAGHLVSVERPGEGEDGLFIFGDAAPGSSEDPRANRVLLLDKLLGDRQREMLRLESEFARLYLGDPVGMLHRAFEQGRDAGSREGGS